MGSPHFRLALFLCIAVSQSAAAQGLKEASSPAGPDPTINIEQVHEPTLRDQIRVAADRVCTLEVQGPRPTVLIRQASAFLIAPDRAVTSAHALAGGYGILVRNGEVTSGAKLVGLDLIHDVAILKLNSPFDVGEGLKLHGTELLGNERVAILGTTVLMEKVAGLGTLTGVTQPQPLGSFGLAQNLLQQGLPGAPVLNVQGHVVGMITSYLLKESGTRFIVSSAAVLAVPAMNPLDLHPNLVLGDESRQTSEESVNWQSVQQGIHLLLAGQKERAVDLLADQPSKPGQLWHALALIANDRNVEAIEAMDAYIEAYPQEAMGFLLRGRANEQLMQNKLAAADFRTARKLDSKGIYSTMSLARAYLHSNRGQESLQYLKALLVKFPGYVPAMLLRGDMYNGRLRLPESRQCYEEVLAIDPDHPGAWTGLGKILLNKKSSRRALGCFNRALNRDPGNLTAQIGLAQVFVMQRDWDTALENLVPLLEEHPTNNTIIRLAAKTYARKQELERARDLYEQATFLDPDDKLAFLGLGTTYKEMLQHERAIMAFDQVLRIDPKHVGALFSAGFCHLLLGDRGEARARYKSLRFIDPASAEQLFKMIYNK
ncbi:MAG: tetratricopeptide (TPR) repeat protein [Glaciecola sp.]|jgi:tetratricopeptide (TPR) repeat protein